VAGWAAISFGGFFKVGDRVQLGGIKGDVIDIELLRSTVMETGEWIRGDLYNGRVVRVANSFVFKGPVFKYLGDFHFLWAEVVLPVHFGSDYELMRNILLNAAYEIVGGFEDEAATNWKQMLIKYLIEDASLKPIVSITFNENWVNFPLRYVTHYRRRRIMLDAISVKVLTDVEKSGGKVRIGVASMELSHFMPSSLTEPVNKA
jgi:small-conductance mechanosensitive channel